jgi:hypothetical protein
MIKSGGRQTLARRPAYGHSEPHPAAHDEARQDHNSTGVFPAQVVFSLVVAGPGFEPG